MCRQTDVYESKASIFFLVCSVCQRRVDIDGSKLDGDSVCPVRDLIIMAEILLIISASLSRSLSRLLLACLSTSLLSLFHRPKADERSPLWHMTHTFLSFEFFHFTDSLHHTTTPPPLPTHSHACVPTPTHYLSLTPACHPSLPDKTGHGGTPAVSLSRKLQQ